jgi:hypothetical protein
MKTTNRATIVLSAAAAAAALACCQSASEKSTYSERSPAPMADPTPLRYEDSASVAVTADVEAIDYNKRLVTLRYPSGRVTTFTAGPQIQRLNEVKVGDQVTADYAVSLLAELRPPTAEEAANPISVVEVAGRSPQGTEPAAGMGRSIKVVTTVQAIDIDRMLVTLKGPMGDTTTVRARKQENIRKLHVGDTVVITYTEAAVVSAVTPINR